MKTLLPIAEEVPPTIEQSRRMEATKRADESWENEGGSLAPEPEAPPKPREPLPKPRVPTEYVVLVCGLICSFGLVTLLLAGLDHSGDVTASAAMRAYGGLSIISALVLASAFGFWRSRKTSLR